MALHRCTNIDAEWYSCSHIHPKSNSTPRWKLGFTQTGNLFLDNTTEDIPTDIDVNLVDARACENQNRMQFFRWLGIGSCDRAQVCQMIVELHSTFRTGRTAESIISEAFYLFKTPWTVFNSPVLNLWLVCSSLTSKRGQDVYVDSPETHFPISRYSANPATGIEMIDSRYLQRARAEGNELAFIKWLLEKLYVWSIPRLTKNGQTTPELDFFTTAAVPELLLTLRDFWSNYFTDLRGASRPVEAALTSKLSRMQVPCTDGIS